MLTIVNHKGVPGVLGAVVRDDAGGRFLLTCHHVLYGRGAKTGEPVWAVEERGFGRSFVEIGRTVRGEIGRVTHDGRHGFIDGALASLDEDARLPDFVRRALANAAATGLAEEVVVGQAVSKDAAITGYTRGRIIDTAHFDRPFIDGRTFEAPGQILIRSEDDELCFSAAGESGVAVLDEAHRVVGFLWGSNANGEGIAYPAAAALEHFGVDLEVATTGLVARVG